MTVRKLIVPRKTPAGKRLAAESLTTMTSF
jgi:hypothetical protein